MKSRIISGVMKDSFWNFIMILFSKIGGLIFTILLARFLLPEKFGIYNLAMSITLILWILADVGVNEGLIRYFSESLEKNNKKAALARYKYLFKIKLFLTISLSASLLIFSYPLSIYVFKKPDLIFPLVFSSIYLLVYSFEYFYSSFFYIIKKVKYLVFKQLLYESTRIIGVILIFLLISKSYYVIGIIGVLAFSTFLAIIYSFFNLKRFLSFLFSNKQENIDKKDKAKIRKFLFYLGTGNTLALIFISIDALMLGFFLPLEFIGFYFAAWSLIVGLSSFISIANILLPVFTQLKNRQINQAFEKVFKYTLLISVPMVFGVLLFGSYAIITIYGYDYLPATLPLYFLSFLVIEIPLSNALKSVFSAKEKPKFFFYILIAATIMNITLNYTLITSLMKISMTWAITGAAIATSLSRYFYLTGLVFYAKKEIKISFKLIHLIKPFLASIIMAFTLIFIKSKITNVNLFIGIGEIILGALTYFLVLFLIGGIKKEDFLLLKELTA